jgi:MFS family permease
MINGERIAKLARPKILLLGGLGLSFAASLMLPFSDKIHDQYWPLVFPAFIIGTAGTATVFVLTNIAFFRTTPPEYAGTVGAVFNAALQLGAAVGSSATTSIQASVDEQSNSGPGFKGRSAALWFLVAYVALEIVGVAVFYREERSLKDLEARTLEVEVVETKVALA